MTTSTIQSVSLLPVYLQTGKNSKFLSSTVDQLIQPAQLERLNAYIGSTSTPTYSPSDVYVIESDPLRQSRQLDPALVIKDIESNIQDVIALDDIANEITLKGGFSNDFDRLFASDVYSYDPYIDWDKITNFQNYYWMPFGASVIEIDSDYLNIDAEVVGKPSYTTDEGVTLLNGMLLRFNGLHVSDKYQYKEFFVEGTGTSITLVPYDELVTPELAVNTSYALYDDGLFDQNNLDNNQTSPTIPEYVTINRASRDRNPWSRYNRWVHLDVLNASAKANNVTLDSIAISSKRAVRPIIEFKANLTLFNFGKIAIEPIDLIDNVTTDAFLTIERAPILNGATTSTITVDGINLEYGQKIVFAADNDSLVRNTIFQVNIVTIKGVDTLTLLPYAPHDPSVDQTFVVTKGNKYVGTSWRYNGSKWVFAQQKTTLNQAPLFDLFDENGISYSNTDYYSNDFAGNKIFGYEIGTGTKDAVLGFPLSYLQINTVGSYLFKNYFAIGSINLSNPNLTITVIPTSDTYFEYIPNDVPEYKNIWSNSIHYPLTINSHGYYNSPLGLTNNPLNQNISKFSLSDLTDHNKTKSRLITNANPISFALMFIGKKEHNVIDAISKVADQYNQFKLSLITRLSNVTSPTNPADALDSILADINANQSVLSSYYLSDMIGYGSDFVSKTYEVSGPQNTVYPLSNDFDLTSITLQSVLLYLNGVQLVHNIDYKFDKVSSSVIILTSLAANDLLTIREYFNTSGSYVPPTPSKLGLYPAHAPLKYLDETYVTPKNVIQGHDGSITVAFDDYRDDIILEFEKRVYNNIKVQYRPELIDVNSIVPGAFRTSKYSIDEITSILGPEFITWAGQYNIDYINNPTFDPLNYKTWNYKNSYNASLGISFNGSWRSVFEYFYDTDRPATHPWEMLGFDVQPDWWTDIYGPAPYTSGNSIMWSDIEAGRIAVTPTGPTINPFYARPGLSAILPVDEFGNTVPVPDRLAGTPDPYEIRTSWVIGDQGPAEAAWRRSSYWPFVVQKLLALTQPATYASLAYDPANITKNIAGQWTYGKNHSFLSLYNISIHGENGLPTSGYSVFVSEVGQQRSLNYITSLREELTYLNLNLFHKVGGFVNQNTLQVIIDAYDPNSKDPGSILPNENYSVILNVSNPVESIGISGFVIQKVNGEFVVRGYDRKNPYFNYYKSIRNMSTPSITLGGVEESYLVWSASGTAGNTGLGSFDTTTARAATAGTFYQKGQIVLYGTSFYRVTVSHQSGAAFDATLFQLLPSLPSVGGVTVQIASSFDKKVYQVAYGTTFNSIQEVYDLIIGYGEWLTTKGFSFNEYSSELNAVIDWNLSAKEFLYWTTQNWDENSIIALSPFSDKITYKHPYAVVDNVFDNFYDYSIGRADGTPFPQKNLFISRQDGVFTIDVVNSADGIYFARLYSVQKEHALVFDNTTIFGDIIYDIETGERQMRMKLSGFRTANWNGDYFSPGFIYDTAQVSNWKAYTAYTASSVVKFNGNYYCAIHNIDSADAFDPTKWRLLPLGKPTSGLLPNFDYKITQFGDFYSLDIDNFDAGQEVMAQHLTGYTPRSYLNNIFTDPIAQYKFYQGYIREKGTSNAISKLAKASLQTIQGQVEFKEEWAFRIGQYGSFTTYDEIEFPLIEGNVKSNPHIINFVNAVNDVANNAITYVTPSQLTIGTGKLPKFVTNTTTNAFKLLHSGYVRLDDVQATAYNENSILDIANINALQDGDTIWLGFKENGEWDVYRYSGQIAAITGVYVSDPFNQITFTTNNPHGSVVGDIISVVNFNSQVDGIYRVQDVPSPTEISVASTLATITNDPLVSLGLFFKFVSARFNDFDTLPADQILYHYPTHTLLWADSRNGTDNNGWAVYRKVINHDTKSINSYSSPNAQRFGTSISKRRGNNVLVVGATDYYKGPLSGAIDLYKINNNVVESQLSYYMTTGTSATELGHCVVYDDIEFSNTTYGLIFAGAPGYMGSSGTVKISSIDVLIFDEQPQKFIDNPDPAVCSRFGSSIFVERNVTTKTVIIGAPGTIANNQPTRGRVFEYTVTSNLNSVTVEYIQEINPNYLIFGGYATEWGYSIAGAEDASTIAISAPGFSENTGCVFVYKDRNFNDSIILSLSSDFARHGRFGQAMAITPDGKYLAIGAPALSNTDLSIGAVFVYKSSGTEYVLDQIITNPVTGSGMLFGEALDFNEDGTVLVITALGTNSTVRTTFDNDKATFDQNTTHFIEVVKNSGSAYLYSRHNKRFVYSEELKDNTEARFSNTDYGKSVVVDNDIIFVGAPAFSDTPVGAVFQFDRINSAIKGWETYRAQDSLVDIDLINRVGLIDTYTDSVVNYYDLIDPLKGKIAGIAEQELSYKSASDPAVYSIGLASVNVDTNTNWLDEHVGELWWDLSSAKYVWYEQSDLAYRKNNWGKLFPGATIDVYEWIGSSLLPSEWSAQADTTAGIAKGISGQPKFVDNSIVSVKQVYDTITDSFSNVYFYWVKNKVTVPDVANRRISSYSVSNIIANPTSAGLQYVSVISSDALFLANLGAEPVGDRISLNISLDKTKNTVPKHTEWALVQEGNPESTLPKLIEKKLVDSLVGHDVLGNNVPDPALTSRTRYGINIRPQQTLFVNRLEALHNIVEFANSVLIKEQITDICSFTNLNKQEAAPTEYITVEDNSELSLIDTGSTSTVTVLSDITFNGGWTVYEFVNNEWVRYRTQAYNTPLYWDYVDWQSPSYNMHRDYSYTVADTYQLASLQLTPGQYVKVLNHGNGNYIIVEKVDPNVVGNFGNDFNIVYNEKGTIQISNSLWDPSFGWDQTYGYSQTLFDQTPNIEIEYILSALKNDIFINNLAVNWNLLFFKAIKYAFTEQKFLDWAFKTSFISVTNYAGNLGQPPVYKLQDSAYYQSYIEEVKPYHTQIRVFNTNFESTETSHTSISDFDFPAYFNTSTGKFTAATVSASSIIIPPVRSITSRIKYDRITALDQIGDLPVTDTFYGDGVNTTFILSWLPQISNNSITVRVANEYIPSMGYDISFYSASHNDYSKKYAAIILTNVIPQANDVIIISYKKSVELMSASERIINYYTPGPGMPGPDLSQVMSGIVYPGALVGGQYEGLGFANAYAGGVPSTYINDTSSYATFVHGQNIGATGTNAVVIDGESSFLTPTSGYGPEELIPGTVVDSLGISVYTKSAIGAPIIQTQVVGVQSGTAFVHALTDMPTTKDSITVVFDNIEYSYIPSVNFTTSTQFTIDWVHTNLILPPQPYSGLLAYTVVGVGSNSTSTLGIIDKQSVQSNYSPETYVLSVAGATTIKGAYVTIDGSPITSTPSSIDPWFELNVVYGSPGSAYVRNLSTGTNSLVQAWFFDTPTDSANFNKILSQTVSVPSPVTTIPLTYPPFGAGPVSAQTIVEMTDRFAVTRRLLPPDMTYHTVTDSGDITYNIRVASTTSVTLSSSNVIVYKNNVALDPAAIIINSPSRTVTIDTGLVTLVAGDLISIETFNPSIIDGVLSPPAGTYTYDYRILGSNLILSPKIIPFLENASLKITTYSNQDSMQIETTRFVGNPRRVFKLDRVVVNSNYVWVQIERPSGDLALINGIDYTVLADRLTIMINDKFALTTDDNVVIMSFSSQTIANTIIGYKIFNDILGKTSFTRISDRNTTYLTQPLAAADTEIHVADATVLSTPIVSENRPGVIVIASERIEFFNINGNVLTQVLRGTGGTSPIGTVGVGVEVIDQGFDQILPHTIFTPYTETVLVQNTFTNTLTNMYTISTVTQQLITYPNTSTLVQYDGINLGFTQKPVPYDTYYNNHLPTVNAIDMVAVYYGGRPLSKFGTYRHDTSVAYDSISTSSIVGTVSTVKELTTATYFPGQAYLVTSTNQVWVCTENQFVDPDIPYFVDSGLRYVPPEFSIITATQTVVLNPDVVSIGENIMLTFVKKQFAIDTSNSWNDINPNNSELSESLLYSTSTVATFLKNSPATLPQQRYYGNDPIASNGGGTIFVDHNGSPIQGY